MNGELINGIDRQQGLGNAGDAALIDGRRIVPQVVIVLAVDLPVGLCGARSVQ